VPTEKQGRRHDNGKRSVEKRGSPFIVYNYILLKIGVHDPGFMIQEWESGIINGNQESGIINGNHGMCTGIRSWESQIRNHELGIRSWESQIGNHELGITNWESQVGNHKF